VTGSNDGSVRVWKGHESHALAPNVGPIDVVSVAETEPTVLIIGKNGKPAIWNITTSECVAALPVDPAEVSAGVISPDGLFCVIGSPDCTCRFYDTRNGEHIRAFKAAESVTTLAICGHTPYVAAGCADGCITLFNFKQNEVLCENQIHDSEITSISFHPELNLILSGSTDMKIIISKAPKLNILYTLGAHKGAVRSVGWSANGEQFVSCGDDKGVFIWTSPGDDFESDYGEEEELQIEEEEESAEDDEDPNNPSRSLVKTPKKETKVQMMQAILVKVQELATVVQGLEQRMTAIDEMIGNIEKANLEDGQVVSRATRSK
jgi:WD40 repeat protein